MLGLEVELPMTVRNIAPASSSCWPVATSTFSPRLPGPLVWRKRWRQYRPKMTTPARAARVAREGDREELERDRHLRISGRRVGARLVRAGHLDRHAPVHERHA